MYRQQDGKCHYCGCGMVLEYRPKQFKSENDPDNLATIEHLLTRLHPKRRDQSFMRKRYVLACKKCNNQKGAEEVSKLSLGELRARSGKRGLAPNVAIILHRGLVGQWGKRLGT